MKELLAPRSFGSFFDLVARGGLLVGPALRKLFDRGDLLIDDGLLLNRWPDHLKSCASKLVDEHLQVLFFEPSQRVHVGLSVGVLKKVKELQTRGGQPVRKPECNPPIEIPGQF